MTKPATGAGTGNREQGTGNKNEQGILGLEQVDCRASRFIYEKR